VPVFTGLDLLNTKNWTRWHLC